MIRLYRIIITMMQRIDSFGIPSLINWRRRISKQYRKAWKLGGMIISLLTKQSVCSFHLVDRTRCISLEWFLSTCEREPICMLIGIVHVIYYSFCQNTAKFIVEVIRLSQGVVEITAPYIFRKFYFLSYRYMSY